MPFLRLLRVGIRAACLLRKRPGSPALEWSLLPALVLVLVLVDATLSYLPLWSAAVEFWPEGLLITCLPIVALLVAAVIGQRALARGQPLPDLFLRLLAAYAVIHAFLGTLLFIWQPQGPRAFPVTRITALVWIAGVSMRTIRAHDLRARNLLARLVVIACIVAPLSLLPNDLSYFYPLHDDQTQAPSFTLDEAALYSQSDRIARVTQAIEPGEGATLFFVGFAPSDVNTVFAKETRAIEAEFAQKFLTARHQATLINGRTDELGPLATRTSLKAVLDRVGSVMHPDRDVLFLYITSHGSEEAGVSVDAGDLTLDDVDPPTLRRLLDDAGIRRRVVVISACHSGIYLPALKGPDTIAIAAAAADRQSFGCSNALDYTYFGRAYFVDGLGQTSSFVDAFTIARDVVAKREHAEGFRPSLPEIEVGADLAKYLQETQFGPH